MIRVAINGYGTIGKRVADVVAAQHNPVVKKDKVTSGGADKNEEIREKVRTKVNSNIKENHVVVDPPQINDCFERRSMRWRSKREISCNTTGLCCISQVKHASYVIKKVGSRSLGLKGGPDQSNVRLISRWAQPDLHPPLHQQPDPETIPSYLPEGGEKKDRHEEPIIFNCIIILSLIGAFFGVISFVILLISLGYSEIAGSVISALGAIFGSILFIRWNNEHRG